MSPEVTTYVSPEVASHRVHDHYPCNGVRDEVATHICPCGGMMLYVCAACGEALVMWLNPETGGRCEHARAIQDLTNDRRHLVRLKFVTADAGSPR